LLAGATKGKPDRVVKLDADNPMAFTFADGKSAVAVVSVPRDGPVVLYAPPLRAGKVVRLDVKTGDVTDTLAELSDADDTLVGAAVHPASGRVFAHYHSSDSVVRCADAKTGKVKWERAVEGDTIHYGYAGPVVAPDGSAVAVGCLRVVQLPQWNGPGRPPQINQFPSNRLHLLDGGTGKPIADLGADDAHGCQACGFSADGRLLFGWVRRNSGSHYTVWDARTGKPLKVWDRQSADVTARFATAGHDLALVERTQTQVVVPAESGELVVENTHQLHQYGRITKTRHSSVVGVWDLAPLAK
jgi:outer membrane protein assembly factor BamB